MKRQTMKASKAGRLSLATRAIHGKHLHAFKGPVTTPIYQTSTYRFENSSDAIRYAKGDPTVYVYTRYHNPTVNEAEDRIALMEGAEAAALFSSGMAAISTAIMAVCRSGDEMVSTPALYGGSYRFFRDTLPSFQIGVSYVEPNSLDDLLYLITPRTKVVYIETPTNPTLSVRARKNATAVAPRGERIPDKDHRHDRQYVCQYCQSAAVRVRCGRDRGKYHEISRRARRSHGRCGRRQARVHRQSEGVGQASRRMRRSVCRIPPRTEPEDVRPPGQPPDR